MTNMVHLHNHSSFSYKETFTNVDQIINHEKGLGNDSFSISDTDSVSSFFVALNKARLSNMKMVPSYEAKVLPEDDAINKEYLENRLSIISSIYRRKKIDEKMVNKLSLFGIDSEIGSVSEEISNKMLLEYNKLSDIVNNKVRLDSGQLKDSNIPFSSNDFKLLFTAYNKTGLNNLMKIFGYDEWDEEENKYLHVTPKFSSLSKITKLIEDSTKKNSRGLEVPTYKREVFNVFEGIYLLTGFDGTEVSWYLERDQYDKAKDLVLNYMKKTNVFLVLEGHGIERDHKVNNLLIKLVKDIDSEKLKLVAANDTYYQNEDEAGEFELFQSIFKFKTSEDFHKKNQHMMTQEDMTKYLLETGIDKEFVDESIKNVQELVDSVDYIDFPKGHHLRDMNDQLREACESNLEKLYPTKDINGKDISVEDARERMNYELETIKDMGFSEYFIKVKQITDTLYDMGALKGTSRGSAGGSIVSYLARITDVDPIKYGLFFERFLNKGRGNQPIIDKKTGKQMLDYSGEAMWKWAYPDIDLDMQSEIDVY